MYRDLQLLFTLISVINIVAGIVLYRKEVKDGLTLSSAARRNAVATCTLMSILFGGATVALMLYQNLERK